MGWLVFAITVQVKDLETIFRLCVSHLRWRLVLKHASEMGTLAESRLNPASTKPS